MAVEFARVQRPGEKPWRLRSLTTAALMPFIKEECRENCRDSPEEDQGRDFACIVKWVDEGVTLEFFQRW